VLDSGVSLNEAQALACPATPEMTMNVYGRVREGRLAAAVLNDSPVAGADVADGIASIRAMLAIGESAATGRRVNLADVSGAV
jgi:predicted dehydrogenase